LSIHHSQKKMLFFVLVAIEKHCTILHTYIMAKKIVFLFLLMCVVSGSFIFAEGENLTVKVAVMGPGSELYFWWGHIALVIEDSDTGENRFYDYGLFSFDSEKFFYNFAFGRLLYSCGVDFAERNIAVYMYFNRSITFYTLDLLPEKRLEIRDFVETNVLPENRNYYYHHFKDNCSTRIRDIIDLATDGQFWDQYGLAPGRFTLRGHVRRHTWFSPAADWLLNFLMGQVIDTPVTAWEEMFLPSEIGKNILDFSYTDANGVRRKLVNSVEKIYEPKGRPIVLDTPRKQWPMELAFSLALSAIFGFFLFMRERGKKLWKVLYTISMDLCALVFGSAGLLLYFMSLFTNHDYTFQNMNMIFCTPLLLAVIPLSICYAKGKNSRKKQVYGSVLTLLWQLTVLGIFISMVLKILPQFYQDNLTDQMLLLPIALVFSIPPADVRGVFGNFFRRKKT